MLRMLVRVALPAVLVACLSLEPRMADAAPWMFQPSLPAPAPLYLAPGTVVDPRVVGGPLYTSPQGAYLRGAYRLSRTQINVRGRTVDQMWHWESWVQGGQQY